MIRSLVVLTKSWPWFLRSSADCIYPSILRLVFNWENYFAKQNMQVWNFLFDMLFYATIPSIFVEGIRSDASFLVVQQYIPAALDEN